MIRRDYILRMLQEFLELLSRLRSLKRDQRWSEATGLVEEEVRRLLGTDPRSVLTLSETELLAKLIQGEPSQAVREKMWLVTTLLKEAGEAAAGEGRIEDSRAFFLKGLHLLLETLTENDDADFPDFVPRVELFVSALESAPLPLETQARLMQHYERSGQYAKAEDQLFTMLEAAPVYPGLKELGIGFYKRLQGKSDRELSDGGLPREEVEAGLAELSHAQKPHTPREP
jgi:uncharacterized protein DUF6483